MARLSFHAYAGRTRRPTLTPTAGGIHDIAERPDPNNPADLYRQRSGPQELGSFGAGGMQRLAPPTADPTGFGLMSRGAEQQRQFQAEENAQRQAEGLPIRVSSTLSDPRWSGLFQALFEQGVEHVGGGPSVEGSNAFRGETIGDYAQPIATTLNYSQLPAGVSEERFSRDVDVAAKGGRRPSYLWGETPSTKAKFERRFKGAQRALAEELRRQQEEEGG